MRTEHHPTSLLRLLNRPERNLSAKIDELMSLVDAVLDSANPAEESRAS